MRQIANLLKGNYALPRVRIPPSPFCLMLFRNSMPAKEFMADFPLSLVRMECEISNSSQKSPGNAKN